MGTKVRHDSESWYTLASSRLFVAHPAMIQDAGTQTSVAEDESRGTNGSAMLFTPAQLQDELVSLRAAVQFLLAKGYGMYRNFILS